MLVYVLEALPINLVINIDVYTDTDPEAGLLTGNRVQSSVRPAPAHSTLAAHFWHKIVS